MNTPEHNPMNTDETDTVNTQETEAVNGTVVPFTLRPDSASTPDEIPVQEQRAAARGEVIDGEIVDDEDTDDAEEIRHAVPVDPPAPPKQSWWEATKDAKIRPLVPEWARTRAEFRDRVRWVAFYAGHTTAFHAIRSPQYAGILLLRSPRGLWRVVVATHRWIYDAEGKPLRAAAVTANEYDKYFKLAEVRAERIRKRGLVAFLALLVAAAGVFVLASYSTALLWLLAAASVGVLGKIGTPADKPMLGRAVVTSKAPKLTSDVVVRALGALGISQINQAVAKGPGITFPAPITRDGPGWRAEVDLPHGVTATDVMERRDKLASGLRRPLGCVWPEPVSEEHSGRLVVWVGDTDLSKAKPAVWPLAKKGEADLFAAVPFGTDQRGRPIGIDLMFANMVIGAMPRMGKTFSLRVLVLAAALDPWVELVLWELKGTGDLGMFEKVAHEYGSGADDDTLEGAMNSLRRLYKELERRSKTITRIAKENRALCPENKVTPQLSRNRKLGLHPIFAAMDECQELFSHDEYKDEAKKLAEGIIKRGPAMGIILVLATQRPDAASLPPGVSANAGLRFCLRVMGQTENDMVLGTSSYKNGIRATTFGAKDKGIGYLVGATDDPQIVRSYYIDGPAAEKIVDRAHALRDGYGTLTGHAVGQSVVDEGGRPSYSLIKDVAAVIRVDEAKIWSETVVDRLAELRPDVYGEWATLDGRAKGNQLASALKPFRVETIQVHGRTDGGKAANRRGIERAAVLAAINGQ
ncbi:FtsK/SpoIIIE domain-containing protein [Amycolatopsis sp.]|uniref:FtsK/SpoIIIE domain-containing protein n=1 Tax=Amycolatopsis sp. TaxID=37632 RepID=UPI002C819ECE|nr:FtsK/SpoIIIE domain-containing protein [Amycolatopsis sp.]HVV10556.1 FtsK/SpoIIIE domain-containing protein [Amycolatopsis sp.]